MITLKIILITGILVGLYHFSSAKTEEQKYSVIYKDKDFEIRFYPEAILASVEMQGNYDNIRNNGFRVLAGYIFGGNEDKTKISMTAPVRMSSNAGASTMSFIMPSGMKYEKMPEPLNENIRLHKSTPVYTASIRYGGYTDADEIKKHHEKLLEKLESLGIKHKTNFEYLGYNPPYQMINRRNEVLVELVDFKTEQIGELLD